MGEKMVSRVVWLNGIVIDTVYFIKSMDNDEVKQALIQADGYSSDIKVTYI